MKNKKDRENREADKHAENTRARGKSKDASAARVEVKPEIVKDIPDDMGHHGSDPEKDLNPEE